MTNKEIIIDGVDVSDCEHLEYKGCNFPQCLIKTASFDLKCEGYNCYLKRYKRTLDKIEKNIQIGSGNYMPDDTRQLIQYIINEAKENINDR